MKIEVSVRTEENSLKGTLHVWGGGSFIYSSFTIVTSQGKGNHSVIGIACDYLHEILGQMFCKEMLIVNQQVARFTAAIYSADIFF